MKAKLGIILALLCVVSFFIYDWQDVKKTKKQDKEVLINGKIVDAVDNTPISGVTIAIQGTNPKSLSNAEGEYAIMARGSDELVFKHAKYRPIVILAKDAKAIKMEVSNSDSTKILEDKPE